VDWYGVHARDFMFNNTEYVFRRPFFLDQVCYPSCVTVKEDVRAFPDQGGEVAIAAGLYDTFNQDNKPLQIVVSVETLLLFRTCLAALYDAAQKEKKFVLFIADNGKATKARMEEISQTHGFASIDGCGYPVRIEGIAKAFGISFVRSIDPNDALFTIGVMREAFEYLKRDRSGPAVIMMRQKSVPL
jgi:TPP-dependent indolepyruvate ferredoxin oxidoreductase alpha subunit